MSKQLKYILISLVVLVIGIIAWVVYRMFFQFNQQEIKIYIQDEANKYKDPGAVTNILHEGVAHVLSSHTLTQQVLTTARKTGTDKEQLLVQTAIRQCIAYGYLPAKA